MLLFLIGIISRVRSLATDFQPACSVVQDGEKFTIMSYGSRKQFSIFLSNGPFTIPGCSVEATSSP